MSDFKESRIVLIDDRFEYHSDRSQGGIPCRSYELPPNQIFQGIYYNGCAYYLHTGDPMIEEADAELEALRKKRMEQLHRMLEKEQEKAAWPSSPVHVTDLNFQQTISEYGVVLVDFWASWCSPCKMIAPILDQLAQEFKGRAVVAKLDVDRNRKTADAFKVSGIPTLILFKDGRPIERVTGALPRNALKGLIQRNLQ